jgi:hypothetical protein
MAGIDDLTTDLKKWLELEHFTERTLDHGMECELSPDATFTILRCIETENTQRNTPEKAYLLQRLTKQVPYSTLEYQISYRGKARWNLLEYQLVILAIELQYIRVPGTIDRNNLNSWKPGDTDILTLNWEVTAAGHVFMNTYLALCELNHSRPPQTQG